MELGWSKNGELDGYRPSILLFQRTSNSQLWYQERGTKNITKLFFAVLHLRKFWYGGLECIPASREHTAQASHFTRFSFISARLCIISVFLCTITWKKSQWRSHRPLFYLEAVRGPHLCLLYRREGTFGSEKKTTNQFYMMFGLIFKVTFCGTGQTQGYNLLQLYPLAPKLVKPRFRTFM